MTPAEPSIIAVIPAFNEAGHVGKVVSDVQSFVDKIVVIDDGSTDSTGDEARLRGACVFRHLVNRGLGGSIITGLRAAIRLGADVIVTLDADGQHVASEITEVIGPILRNEADFVIGSRLIKTKSIPLSRIVANRIADFCTWILFGVRVRDSQSGFRAFSRVVAESIELRTSRMEISTEILSEVARKGFRISEIPITAIYTQYSLSKGQSFSVGLKTLVKLLFRRIG